MCKGLRRHKTVIKLKTTVSGSPAKSVYREVRDLDYVLIRGVGNIFNALTKFPLKLFNRSHNSNI